MYNIVGLPFESERTIEQQNLGGPDLCRGAVSKLRGCGKLLGTKHAPRLKQISRLEATSMFSGFYVYSSTMLLGKSMYFYHSSSVSRSCGVSYFVGSFL